MQSLLNTLFFMLSGNVFWWNWRCEISISYSRQDTRGNILTRKIAEPTTFKTYFDSTNYPITGVTAWFSHVALDSGLELEIISSYMKPASSKVCFRIKRDNYIKKIG